jgi:hypothetical protein
MASPRKRRGAKAPRVRVPVWVRVPAWVWVGVVAAAFVVANFGYGALCENRCDELCGEQGFADASWRGSSGFGRLVSAASGNHGTCICTGGQPASAKGGAAVKSRELPLTFAG